MKILRALDHRRMPWKNGRGETVEIAVFPDAATVDTFDWRISMATVAEDGPFSVFPEIDRTLSILEGEGMELAIEGRDTTLLTQASAPYPFPADAPTTARLVDGTITDLNVMTRRGRFAHEVETITAPASIETSRTLTLLLCHRGEIRVAAGKADAALAALDCALLEAGTEVSLSGSGSGFVIRLFEGADTAALPLPDADKEC
ncbi:HutD family protein [Neorhizobium sp. NCHU2750]|uniref:HutD/Ves family protein n=1 Tax=Neorhizobium sp. NCHU2750 TaxID=1825976 RepID=UPI000E75D35A